jgi:hypothetical protein
MVTMGISAQRVQEFNSFDPDIAAAMGLAFDTAWQRLIVSGSDLVSSFRAEKTREALALRIIHLVSLGERDIIRLRDDAIAHVQQLAETAQSNVPPPPLTAAFGRGLAGSRTANGARGPK